MYDKFFDWVDTLSPIKQKLILTATVIVALAITIGLSYIDRTYFGAPVVELPSGNGTVVM